MTATEQGSAVLPGRYFEDVGVGEELPPVSIPLTVYRLVMAAGSNRDFNSIHHNSEYARSTGAEEMYANTSFLMSSWERLIRDWCGVTGRIRAIKGFRMRAFNYAGTTMRVIGVVESARVDPDDAYRGIVEVGVRCEGPNGTTVGPGTVHVELPLRTPVASERKDNS